MAKLALVLTVLVVMAAAAAAQSRCKMPQLWEARQIRFDPNRREYHNQTSAYRTYAHYTYDGINLRKHRYEDATYGDSAEERLEVLELYSEGKAYVTNVQTRVCQIYNLDHEFHRHDISPTASFQGYEIIGSAPDSIELSQWVDKNATYHGQTGGHQYQTFTKECVPVRDDFFTQETGFHYEEFSDVTVGNSDPNVWIPPSNCKPAY